MAAWVRNLVMVVVMIIWSVFILVTLSRSDEVPQLVWGLPGVVYFALNPTWKKPEPPKPKDE
jgi:hypothetical protein